MLIESIIKREGGTHVTLGENAYHFQPREDGRHVADVQDDEDADTLLAITEGYRAVDEDAQAASDTVKAEPAPKKPARKTAAKTEVA